MNFPRSLSQIFSSNVRSVALNNIHKSFVHLDTTLLGYEKSVGPKKWITYNNKIYPPQTLNEEPRPAVSDFVAGFS